MKPVCSLTIFGGFDYTDNDTFFTHKLPKLKSGLTLKKPFQLIIIIIIIINGTM